MVIASVPGENALMPMVVIEEGAWGDPIAEVPTRAIGAPAVEDRIVAKR